VGSTINSNILANSNLYSKRLWGMNQRVRGRVLMKKTRGKISHVSVPLNCLMRLLFFAIFLFSSDKQFYKEHFA
jgi:hypothetical protein